MMIGVEKRQWNWNRGTRGNLWYILRRKMVWGKPLKRVSGMDFYIKWSWLIWRIVFFIVHVGTNEKDRPPPFHIQPRVYAVTVVGKSQILELYLQNYHCFFYIMDKEKGLQGLNQILDEREECLVDRDREVYDPFLSMGNVSVIKERLWWYNS